MTASRTVGREGLDVGETDGGRRFALPPEVATQATAIFGIRGSGKTVTATVIVEELLERGLPVAIIDPTDVWWGLKSSADGKSEGFGVVVLGGPHGDLPLEEHNGWALADFAVEERVPMILSLRHLRKDAQMRFVTDFCEQLYHRKGELAHRTPHLVTIDEASTFVPQKVGRGEARMVGAVEDLVRRGRAAGIGVALIDGRPASVNKDVLTQAEVLVSHRVTNPHDSRALDDWIRQNDAAGHRNRFLEGLPTLPDGTGWFWSPSLGVFDLVGVKMRKTYDSSRTPELDETPMEPPEAWAAADLEALQRLLQAKGDAAQQEDDPAVLRRRVRELETALARGTKHDGDASAPTAARTAELERRLRDAEGDKERAIRRATAPMEEEILALRAVVQEAREYLGASLEVLRREGEPPASEKEEEPADALEAPVDPSRALEEAPEPPGDANPPEDRHRENGSERARPVPEEREDASVSGDGSKPAKKRDGRRRILGALAHLEALGISPVPRATLAAYADFKPSKEGGGSGTFRDYLAEMGREGWVLSEGGGVRLMEQGREEAARLGVAYSGPRSLNEFHERLTERLPEKAARMLRVVIDRYPDGIPREDLAREIGMTTSGTFRLHAANFGRLGLVASKGGRVRATERLFPEGLE